MGRTGNMTQLGGDFVFGPGMLHTAYFFTPLAPTFMARSDMYFCVADAAYGGS